MALSDIGQMPKSPIASKSPVKIMDFRPSSGLAAGLKRVGGRSGTSRLGRSPIKLDRMASKVSHKY